MRVTLVSAYDPFPPAGADNGHVGGVERVFAQFARSLVQRDHDVTMVCSSEQDSRSVVDGVDVRRVRRRGTIMRAPVANLASHIPGDSDMVHVAASYPFVTPGVVRYASKSRMPCILDFHFEPDPVTPVGRLAARLYRMVGPPAYAAADQVLVRSLDYARSAPSLRHVPIERQRAMPNGVDVSQFTHDGPRRGDGHMLFVGRLVPYKGLNTLLHALPRVEDAPPLWIAGDGPLRQELAATAKRLGVDVRFLGRVPDADLPALYRGASLTVLPSVGRQECFGITLLESMACGTPVLASDLPGVRAVAKRGGRTAAPGDPAAWAQAVRHAILDPVPGGPELAQRIRLECAWPAVVDQLESVYRDVVRP